MGGGGGGGIVECRLSVGCWCVYGMFLSGGRRGGVGDCVDVFKHELWWI